MQSVAAVRELIKDVLEDELRDRDQRIYQLENDLMYLSSVMGDTVLSLQHIVTWNNLAECSGGTARVKIDELASNITANVTPLLNSVLAVRAEQWDVSLPMVDLVCEPTREYKQSLIPDYDDEDGEFTAGEVEEFLDADARRADREAMRDILGES